MTLTTANEQNIIERDIYCPFCQNEKAMLISGLAEKTSTLQAPGNRFYILKLIFTFFGAMFTSGFKIFEKKQTYKYATYGFCSCCGKSFNAGVPLLLKQVPLQEPSCINTNIRKNSRVFVVALQN